jgi:hypothetical protein
LNKFVREQRVWTAAQMKSRTDTLARRAVGIWPALLVEQSLIDAANSEELRVLAARRDVSKIKMSAEAKALFEELRSHEGNRQQRAGTRRTELYQLLRARLFS